jgi:hypothetical protein
MRPPSPRRDHHELERRQAELDEVQGEGGSVMAKYLAITAVVWIWCLVAYAIIEYSL